MSRPPITDADVEALAFARFVLDTNDDMPKNFDKQRSAAIRVIDAITTHHKNTLTRRERRVRNKRA